MLFLIQTAVFPALGIRSIAPELLIPILVLTTLRASRICAALLAAVFGLLMDVLYTPGIGIYGLSYVLSVCMTTWLAGLLSDDNIFTFLCAVLCGLLTEGIINTVVIFFARMPLEFTGVSLLRHLLNIALTEAAAFVLYLLLGLWYDKFEEKRRIALK